MAVAERVRVAKINNLCFFTIGDGGGGGVAGAVTAELLRGLLIGVEAYPGVTAGNGIFIVAMNAQLFRPKGDFAMVLANRLGQIKGVPPATGFQ